MLVWSSVKAQVEDRAAHLVDPKSVDHVVAVLGTLCCIALVVGSICTGWLSLWHSVLHKIGFFREIMGLNRVRQQEARQQVEREIHLLKKQLGR